VLRDLAFHRSLLKLTFTVSMTTSSPFPLHTPDVHATETGEADKRGTTISDAAVVASVLSHRTLDAIDRNVAVEVVSLALEDDLVAWLRAVGIAEGERIVVLRRAAFGGPLHIRTSSGGEFALHRSLACSIHIRSVPEDAA
jgi:ferrous iron transport protein A